MEYTFYKFQVGNECYVGSTNDYKRRMRENKFHSLTKDDTSHKTDYKLYDYIRNNGGWEQCKCSWFSKVKIYKRNIIKAYYIKLFNATLNTYSPVNDRIKISRQYYLKIRERNNVKGCCDICGVEMIKCSIPRHKLRKH